MIGRIRKTIVFILILAMVCGSLFACGKKADPIVIDGGSMNYVPPKTVTPDYVMAENPITVRNASTSSPLKISGLKDANAQDRINNAISDEYARLSAADFVPPVTGAKVLEKKYASGRSETFVYSSVAGNVENVLSVCISYNKFYYPADQQGAAPDTDHISYESYLVFDLTTGSKLKLADLFIDGVDPVKYVNSKIAELIAQSDLSTEGWSEDSEDQLIRVSGSFKGINADQPFYVDMDGRLVVCFDARNPELIDNVGTRIDIYDVSNLGRAQVKLADIYEGSVSKYRLVQRPFPASSIKPIAIPGTVREDESDQSGKRYNYYSEVHNYAELSDSINKYLSLDWMNAERIAKDARYRAAEYTSADDTATGYFRIYSYANRIGGYINTSVGYTEYYNSPSLDKEYYRYEENHLRCYKEGSDEPLAIEDIFWDKAKATELIKNAQISVFKRDTAAYYRSNYNILNRLAQDLAEHVCGFSVGVDFISLEYDVDVYELVSKYFTRTRDSYRRTLVADTGFLDYTDLGYDNLRIFK